MKRILLPLFAAFALVATLSAQTLSERAAGEYAGTLYVNLASPVTEESEPLYELDEDNNTVTDAQGNPVLATFKVKIETQGDNTVKFGLYDFGFMGLKLGDIVLNEVPVEAKGDKVVFGKNDPVSFNFLDGMILATAKINEEASYVEGETAYIDVDVVWTNSDASLPADDTSDDVPIYVRFIGKKDAAPANPYDLNGDGTVNVGDVTTLVNMILGKAPMAEGADLNGDGSVNVGDVTTLVNTILGK
ncbi:MAG: hypothetical protein IKR63_03550 [Alloprevotella sp.]|nr:hypothetical protein [Alloprevotella sp.]